MGTVYEAVDQRLDATVAIKETFFTDERLRKQFEREARLLARLHHPALPRVSDHFTEGDGQFLVMQFIAGDDLSALLEKRGAPFPPEQVFEWGDQLLDALDYLHTQETPIIHRDIKPQNLKLTARGQIILLDFGLAKGFPGQVSRVTTSGSIFGYTPNYAPLEQIQGTGTDPRSDLYSLGATLYHLVTNITPPDVLSRASAVLGGRADPLRPADEVNADVPPEVAAVLAAATAISPEQRPKSAAEMRQSLRDGRAPRAVERSESKETVLPPTVIAPSKDEEEERTEEKRASDVSIPPTVASPAPTQKPQTAEPTIASAPLGITPKKIPFADAQEISQPVKKKFPTPASGLAIALLVLAVAAFIYVRSSTTEQANEEANNTNTMTTTGTRYIATGNEGTITGRVLLNGAAPALIPIDISADAACAQKNPNLRTEDLLSSNGGLQNAFVYIKSGTTSSGSDFTDMDFGAPSSPVTLDQNGCHYVPHVLGMMVNQRLQVTNSDPTVHNVHAMPRTNVEWNQSQPQGAPPIVKTFQHAETLIPVKCNQHPWMKAYVAVLSHPFFAVSASDGRFEIRGVPPGRYTVVAWHEKLGEQTMNVVVGRGASTSADFTFNASALTSTLQSNMLKIMPALELPMQ